MPGQIKEIININEAIKDLLKEILNDRIHDILLRDVNGASKDDKDVSSKSNMGHVQFIFDLDNTVMESRLDLGGDSWYCHLLAHAFQQGLDKKLATELVIAVYRNVQALMCTKAVEPEIVRFIQFLQELGFCVIGLTARDKCLEPPTVRQLAENGVNFSKIIYCDGGPKGEYLKEFLVQGNQPLPQHIIMFDDKRHHLEHVEEAISPLGIAFTGFRYGFLDEKVKGFDAVKAAEQLVCLRSRLPLIAQQSIGRLHLIPVEVESAGSSLSWAHGFFHARPKRAESASSFFATATPKIG